MLFQEHEPQEKPNHRIYLQVLRQMSPEQRLLKAFELTEFTRELFLHGLRKRYPASSAEDLKQIFLKHLDKCHNRIIKEDYSGARSSRNSLNDLTQRKKRTARLNDSCFWAKRDLTSGRVTYVGKQRH